MVHEDERLVKTKPREDDLASLLVPTLGPFQGPQPPPQITFLPPKIGVHQGDSGQETLEQPHVKLGSPESHGNSKSTEKLDAIDVKMHRSLDGVENYESLYVTVSWKDHTDHQYERSNLTSGVVKLRVICESSETKEEIKLKGDEDSVTIEITVG